MIGISCSKALGRLQEYYEALHSWTIVSKPTCTLTVQIAMVIIYTPPIPYVNEPVKDNMKMD